MEETRKIWICPREHDRDGVTSGQAGEVDWFCKPVVVGVEGNEEFLDRLDWIFVQQVIGMEHEEGRKRREAAVSDSNTQGLEEAL